MTDEVTIWKQCILEQKANGQTVIDWCRQHNVTKGSYHYWRRQVKKAESSSTEHTVNTNSNTEPVIFAKLDRTEPFQSVLQVTWQDVKIHLSSSQEACLVAELIAYLCHHAKCVYNWSRADFSGLQSH